MIPVQDDVCSHDGKEQAAGFMVSRQAWRTGVMFHLSGRQAAGLMVSGKMGRARTRL
jgi:hypothetical protein